MESTLRKINRIELEEHNDVSSLWVVVNGKVYDLTEFHTSHPGGPEIVISHAGKDATSEFENANHPAAAKRDMEQYLIGEYV